MARESIFCWIHVSPIQYRAILKGKEFIPFMAKFFHRTTDLRNVFKKKVSLLNFSDCNTEKHQLVSYVTDKYKHLVIISMNSILHIACLLFNGDINQTVNSPHFYSLRSLIAEGSCLPQTKEEASQVSACGRSRGLLVWYL